MKIPRLTNIETMPKVERLRINRVIKAINDANLSIVEHRMLLVAINQAHLEDNPEALVTNFAEQMKVNGMAQTLYERNKVGPGDEAMLREPSESEPAR